MKTEKEIENSILYNEELRERVLKAIQEEENKEYRQDYFDRLGRIDSLLSSLYQKKNQGNPIG